MFTSRSTNTIPAPITTATLLLLCTNVNTITTTATAVAGTVSWQITQLLRTDATSVATTTLALLDSNPSYQHRRWHQCTVILNYIINITFSSIFNQLPLFFYWQVTYHWSI
jgi:hypothetical protein